MTRHLAAFALLLALPAVAEHPQTVWNAQELLRLQASASTTHASLAFTLGRYLDIGRPTLANANVGGYALATRLLQRPPDEAVRHLTQLCQRPWSEDLDVEQASDLASASLAYDVLFDELDLMTRVVCRARILASAEVLADAAAIDGTGQWWANDLLNNHNWVVYAALGIAGQALEGEAEPNATLWQRIALNDFRRVQAMLDLIQDGSWHEGIGYMEYGLSRALPYWMGMVRRGQGSLDRAAMLGQLGGYLLYAQHPNQPRVHVMTHGDWNWARPGLHAVLRWTARRFRDPLAQEAARRWVSDPLEVREEWGTAYALAYIAYDPTVKFPAMSQLPLDRYNGDQQSMLMRSDWGYGCDADGLVLGFKAGVFGGRANKDRIAACGYPGGDLNYSHDHEDDLGLWIYGRGGWLLPEAVAYNCCDGSTGDYQGTSWHNTLLFDDIGQMGDTKTLTGETGIACGKSEPGWFADREASMPLHASTDHYAFARGVGTRLYPPVAQVARAERTVGFSRDGGGGYFTLQDRAETRTPRVARQLFHSMSGTGSREQAPWVLLDNTVVGNEVTRPASGALGIRVFAPAGYRTRIGVQSSNSFREFMSDTGRFGKVELFGATPTTSTTFLELLWPTTMQDWGARPDAQPLDAGRPERGFTVALPGGGSEAWVYNVTGGNTAAGPLRLEGRSTGDIAVVRYDGTQAPVRLVLQGTGALRDRDGARLLLDLKGATGVLEVAITGARASLSGSVTGALTFHGPGVTEVRRGGATVAFTRAGDLITVAAAVQPDPKAVQHPD